jgi:glycosyltransferase involved in cell wall biosynthesis
MGPFLSIVIPAYNEQERISRTLEAVVGYLASRPYTWEVVVVDDGSTDGTSALVHRAAEDQEAVRLIQVPHRGKGWAVKHGMLGSAGEYRFLCDADLSMPIDQVSRFLPPENGCFDVAIGSREVQGSRRIGEPATRYLMGRLYNMLVRAMALPRLSDTQCGFKCFRGEAARQLFPLQRFHGFSFDVEVLFLASRRNLRIVEVPIDWYYRSQSKVRPVRDSLAMARDILRMRWRHVTGGYRWPDTAPSTRG